MRVGGSPYSAHQAGMSALWHDVDYIPEKRFETPLVRGGLEDMALPSEQHQLPDGVDDPFKKLDEVYDVAAAQMDRGIKGSTFLHGRPPAEISDPHRDNSVDDVTKTMMRNEGAPKSAATERKVVEAVRTDLEQVRMTNQAAAITVPTTKGASKTAAESEAEANAHAASSIGDGVGAAMTFVPMAAGQAVQSVVQGPLPAMAAQALTVTSGVIGAGQLTAAGVAEGLREDEPVVVRRGLSREKTKA